MCLPQARRAWGRWPTPGRARSEGAFLVCSSVGAGIQVQSVGQVKVCHLTSEAARAIVDHRIGPFETDGDHGCNLARLSADPAGCDGYP